MDNKQNYKSIGLIGLFFILFGLVWAAIGELFVDTTQQKGSDGAKVVMKEFSLELPTNNIDSTLKFYEKVLGFNAKIKNNATEREVILFRDDVKITFYEKYDIMGVSERAFKFNLFMKNIKDFHSRVVEKHRKEIPLIKNEMGELEFQLTDNNGYKIIFVEYSD